MGTFVAANTALNSILVVMVVIRKVRRDRRERRHGSYQRALRQAIAAGGAELTDLLRLARRQPALLRGLVSVLSQEAGPDDATLPRLRAHAEEAGLTAGLKRQLESRRPAVRGTAVVVIGRLRLAEGPRLVAALLEDPDGDVRLAAAAALGRLGGERSASALIDALGRGVVAKERLIEQLGAAWATPSILAALADGRRTCDGARASLARALGLGGDPQAEPAMMVLAVAGNREERLNAVRALGACGSVASASVLRRALREDVWEVRAQAATAVAELGLVQAVPELKDALRHQAWWVRSNGAVALTRLGAPGLAALVAAREGDDPYAAERAHEALAVARPGDVAGTEAA